MLQKWTQNSPNIWTILAENVKKYGADLLVLAGWMRVLTQDFIGQFPNIKCNLMIFIVFYVFYLSNVPFNLLFHDFQGYFSLIYWKIH